MLLCANLLKSYAISNLNRDKSGCPKNTDYGGVLRALRSGQNVKFTIRHSKRLRSIIIEDENGHCIAVLATRTRNILQAIIKIVNGSLDELKKIFNEDWLSLLDVLLEKEIMMFTVNELKLMKNSLIEWGKETSQSEEFKDIFNEYPKWYREMEEKIKEAKKSGKSEKITYKDLKDEEKFGTFGKLTKSLYEMTETENIVKKALLPEMTIDIALNGRFTATDPSYRVDGALLTSFSMTTHEVTIGSDFFTAVDDVVKNGSAHMGYREFTTGCFYENIAVDIDILESLLHISRSEALRIAIQVIITFIDSTSESHQHDMASNPLPDLTLLELRKYNVNRTYSAAFEKPIVAEDDGYVLPSIKALKTYVEAQTRAYDYEEIDRYWITPHDIKIDPEIGTNCSLMTALKAIENYDKS